MNGRCGLDAGIGDHTFLGHSGKSVIDCHRIPCCLQCLSTIQYLISSDRDHLPLSCHFSHVTTVHILCRIIKFMLPGTIAAQYGMMTKRNRKCCVDLMFENDPEAIDLFTEAICEAAECTKLKTMLVRLILNHGVMRNYYCSPRGRILNIYRCRLGEHLRDFQNKQI